MNKKKQDRVFRVYHCLVRYAIDHDCEKPFEYLTSDPDGIEKEYTHLKVIAVMGYHDIPGEKYYDLKRGK